MDLCRTADGRVLEYLEVGDPGGRPVVYLPGTPSTAGSATLFEEAARRQRVRLIAVSRPGYGASTTTPPGLVSVARDVGELLSVMEVGEFAVLATSGGGPFALATGAVLANRVQHVLLAASPGAYYEVAPDVLEPRDREALDLLASGQVTRAVAMVTADVRLAFDPMTQLPRRDFETAFRATAPATEHYFDSRPVERTTFFDDVYRALTTYDGFVRDNLSWLGRWDFDLDDVRAPVLLQYGDTDASVPPAHGEWIAARLPRAELTVHRGADHGAVCFGLAESLFEALT